MQERMTNQEIRMASISIEDAMNLARKDEAEGFAEWAGWNGWVMSNKKVWIKPFVIGTSTTQELYTRYKIYLTTLNKTT